MANYLITGIAGFVGSSIARSLVLRGDHVSGIDNLSTGSLDNLYPLSHAIRFMRGDIRDRALLERACRGVDCIFHEAAVASVQQSIADPVGTESINLNATLELVEVARTSGVKRLIFASSAAVYGMTPAKPVNEGDPPQPISPYAMQKLQAEQGLQEAWTQHGLETVSLRYFNIFGPRQSAFSPYSGLIARLIRLMLHPDSQDQPEVYGDGEQSRDFVFIEDVVAANLAAAAAPAEKVAGKVFNIATGTASSVNQVAEVIAQRTGYHAAIIHGPAKPGEIRHSLADLSRSRLALNYRPTTDISNGLAKTIDWYRSQATRGKSRGEIKPASITALLDRERDSFIDDLSDAVECGNFYVVFQPIVSLVDGRMTGAEALLRWQNRGKNIPPARFIPLAEETGLIHKLGVWLIRHVTALIGTIGDKLDPEFRLAINVSPTQLESEDSCRGLCDALRQSKQSGLRLEVEITEKVRIHHWTETGRMLDLIHDCGISVALDDFGAGYSNMDSLCRLKVDRIKIDRSIVAASRAHLPVFDGIMAMAQKLNVPVVVVGVETLKQYERVKTAGCQEAQGFYIAKPVSVFDLILSSNKHRASA